MIDHQTVNTFNAKGNYHLQEASIPVQLTGTYKSYSDDPVEICVWSEDRNAPEIFSNSMSYPFAIWFEGESDRGEDILMKGIRPFQFENFTHLNASVDVFIIGDLESRVKSGEELVTHSKVTSTPVIIPEWHYLRSFDGTISVPGDKKERNGICWNNYQGKAQLIDDYEYINGDKDNKEVTLRLQTNSLFLTINPNIEMDLKDVFLQLPKFLSEDLKLLSFIGRKRIAVTEATTRTGTKNQSSFTFARYRTWGGFYSQPSDESFLRSVIWPRFLQQGLFENLITNFRSSQYKQIIDRSISHLLTSYEDGYLETHLVNAYAALETMVDGIGEIYNQNFLLGNNQFKRLSKKIEETIRQEVRDENTLQGIIKKLPELRRRRFLDRLLFLLNTQGVNSKLIWPPNTDEPKEFHEILKRRNDLIHQGVVSSINSSVLDLNRIQKLVELWILKLLECPDDSINVHSLWHDAPINQILHFE